MTAIDIDIPSESDLEPLYQAAEAYGKARGEEWNRWNAVKAEVFKAEGHDNSSRAASVAYQDAEVIRLKSVAKALLAKADEIRDGINDRFPGLNLYSPAAFLGWGEPTDHYRANVRTMVRDYVKHQWRKAVADDLHSARERARKAKPCPKVAPGMVVCDSSSRPAEIVRVTPKGNRIVACDLLTGEEIRFRPSDSLRLIGRKLANDIIRLYRSQYKTLARFDLND